MGLHFKKGDKIKTGIVNRRGATVMENKRGVIVEVDYDNVTLYPYLIEVPGRPDVWVGARELSIDDTIDEPPPRRLDMIKLIACILVLAALVRVGTIIYSLCY